MRGWTFCTFLGEASDQVGQLVMADLPAPRTRIVLQGTLLSGLWGLSGFAAIVFYLRQACPHRCSAGFVPWRSGRAWEGAGQQLRRAFLKCTACARHWAAPHPPFLQPVIVVPSKAPNRANKSHFLMFLSFPRWSLPFIAGYCSSQFCARFCD